METHCPQDAGGEIDGFGGNGEDTTHDAGVQNVRYVGDVYQGDGQDEWGRCDPGAAQQLVVIRGDEQGDEHDASHVDEYHSVRDQFRCVTHGKAWVLSLAAHDADENLIADCPSCK